MGAPANGVYSFQNVSAAIIGPPSVNQIFTGAAGEGYTIEMNDDKSTHVVGADGSGMHSLSASQRGMITFRLLKTSAMNRFMSTLYNFQTTTAANHGRNTVTLTDNNLNDTIVATGGGVTKFTNLTYATEGGTNEWRMQFTYINSTLGDGGVTNLVSNG